MQRIFLAIAAVILTATGCAMLLFGEGKYAGFDSALLRSGLVLGALAIALPQVKRLFEVLPPWFIACGAIGLIVVIKWPRAIAVVLPLLAVLWFLGPRTKQTKKSPSVKKPRKVTTGK